MSQHPSPPGGWPDPSSAPGGGGPDPYPPSGGGPDPYAPGPGQPGGGPATEPVRPAYPASAYGAPAYGAPAAPPGYGYPPPYPYPVAAPTNGLAIAAMVCSLAGLAVGISAPVGAILGHIARRQIRERGEQGDGMALAGIIVGWILTGIMVLCCGGYAVAIGFAINQESNF